MPAEHDCGLLQNRLIYWDRWASVPGELGTLTIVHAVKGLFELDLVLLGDGRQSQQVQRRSHGGSGGLRDGIVQLVEEQG